MSKRVNKKVLLNIGIPGSGKTTWTNDFLAKNPDWVKVARDDYRFMLRNQPFLEPKAENMISDMLIADARKALLTGYNVIVDNTNCKLSYINGFINELNDLADIDYRYFDTPLKTCIERDAIREKKVGETIVKKMHKDLSILVDSFDFQPKKKKERIKLDYSKAWDPALPYAVITDIDGTVAHMNGKRGPFEWKKVGLDDIDQPMVDTLKMLKAAGTTIIACSGRDGSCRQETSDWLTAAEVPFDHLFMRPENDYRKDSIIKKEIYENDIKGKFNIIMVYDDRDQVVEVWRNLGLKCAQVEPGQF